MSTRTCGYQEVYQASCRTPAPCSKHDYLTCESCGQPATRGCPESIMSMFCCQPLCNTCYCTFKTRISGQ